MASVVRERFLPLENASSDFIATINSRKILAEQYIKISGSVTLRTKSHLTNTSESDGDYCEKPAAPKNSRTSHKRQLFQPITSGTC